MDSGKSFIAVRSSKGEKMRVKRGEEVGRRKGDGDEGEKTRNKGNDKWWKSGRTGFSLGLFFFLRSTKSEGDKSILISQFSIEFISE